MIDTPQWMGELLARLKETFGDRLLYLGLQGSYRRGEATEESDIDVVALMDHVSLDDLDAYGDVVHSMPDGELACGFISGRDELLHWPRHELFPLARDTEDHHGRLADFLPPLMREDAVDAARIAVATLYHLLTHSYLYAAAGDRRGILAGAYKSAFFALQMVHSLESGEYCASKRELLGRVNEPERKILTASLDFRVWLASHSERAAFELLRSWCVRVLGTIRHDGETLTVTIEGKTVFSEADFHRQLATRLDIPEFYGHNLNALWDTLSANVERPFIIVWNDSSLSRERLGATFDKILRVFDDTVEHDARLTSPDKFSYILK